MLGPGQKMVPVHPKGPNYNQAWGDYEAGREGHHKPLGKAGVSEDLDVDLLQNPLSVPTAILPLAGLARLFGRNLDYRIAKP